MLYNTINSIEDYNAIDTNFAIFSSWVADTNDLITSLKDFSPFGVDFDKESGHSDFNADGIDETLGGSNEFLCYSKSDNYYYFNKKYYDNTIKKLKYHQGLRFQNSKTINFYNTLINPGTIIYLDDFSYLSDDNTQELIGRAFLYITMPFVWGYNWDVVFANGTQCYSATFSTSFDQLGGELRGKTGNTRWQFYESTAGNFVSFNFDSRYKIIRTDSDPYTFYINKKFVLNLKDKDYHMSPLDDIFNISFFYQNSPIEVDYDVTCERLKDIINNLYLDVIKIKLSSDYKTSTLNWFYNNCKVMVY